MKTSEQLCTDMQCSLSWRVKKSLWIGYLRMNYSKISFFITRTHVLNFDEHIPLKREVFVENEDVSRGIEKWYLLIAGCDFVWIWRECRCRYAWMRFESGEEVRNGFWCWKIIGCDSFWGLLSTYSPCDCGNVGVYIMVACRVVVTICLRVRVKRLFGRWYGTDYGWGTCSAWVIWRIRYDPGGRGGRNREKSDRFMR